MSRSLHWSQLAERGSGLGLRLVYITYRLLGERVARWLLVPIVGYFFFAAPNARRASSDYLRRVASHNHQAPPRWSDSFAHLLAFAQSGLDKLAAWMGGIDSSRIDFPNRATFEELLRAPRGAILIGSHLGNLELTRALARPEQLAKVNAVVYTEHAQRFSRLLANIHAGSGTNLLQVSSFGPDTAIWLQSKIDKGESLVIVGDRTPAAENGRVSQVDFLGSPAAFAQGPFILAALLNCPVYLFFCLRQGGRYRIDFELFSPRIELPRNERQQRLQSYVQQYAKRLQSYCLRAPQQWFNFYDFWKT